MVVDGAVPLVRWFNSPVVAVQLAAAMKIEVIVRPAQGARASVKHRLQDG